MQISSILPSNRLGLRGSVVKLSLAALPLRTRPDFETSRGFCGLAQNSAHHVPVRISSPSRLRSRATPTRTAIKSTKTPEICYFKSAKKL
ncbi:hypothetical protein [Lapidilactobacillus salsurivasis]